MIIGWSALRRRSANLRGTVDERSRGRGCGRIPFNDGGHGHGAFSLGNLDWMDTKIGGCCFRLMLPFMTVYLALFLLTSGISVDSISRTATANRFAGTSNHLKRFYGDSRRSRRMHQFALADQVRIAARDSRTRRYGVVTAPARPPIAG